MRPALDPLPFVPGPILPGWVRITKINSGKKVPFDFSVVADDFSVVTSPFFTPQKNQKNTPNRRKISGPWCPRSAILTLSALSPLPSALFPSACDPIRPPVE